MVTVIEAEVDLGGPTRGGIEVPVYLHGTQTLASLYDSTGTTPASNPALVANTGVLYFYAPPGTYDIVAPDLTRTVVLAGSPLNAPAGPVGGVLVGTLPDPSGLAAASVGDAQADPSRPLAENKVALASDAAFATPSRRSLGRGSGQAAPGAALITPKKAGLYLHSRWTAPTPTNTSTVAPGASAIGYAIPYAVEEPMTLDGIGIGIQTAGTAGSFYVALYDDNSDGSGFTGAPLAQSNALAGTTAATASLKVLFTATYRVAAPKVVWGVLFSNATNAVLYAMLSRGPYGVASVGSRSYYMLAGTPQNPAAAMQINGGALTPIQALSVSALG